MQSETWKDISGYEGLYNVSDTGEIYSIKRGRNIPKSVSSTGYFTVSLTSKTFLVHRLVATAFLSNKDKKRQVNHIDGNKQNNHVSNLEWATPAENIRHSVVNGLAATGERSGHAILTEDDVRWIRVWHSEGFMQKDIAAAFGVHFVTVSDIIRGATWRSVK